MSTEKKMTPTEKAKLAGEASELILKETNDCSELLQILNSVVFFVTNDPRYQIILKQ